jgi:multiple sugar transport system substrate-binding protein
MKTKKVVAIVVALLIAIALSCGAQAAKLTWSFWGADTDRDAWGVLVKNVQTKYPNIQIDLQIADWNTYWQKLQTQIASGGAADIFGIQSGQNFVSYASRGATLSLQKYIDADSQINIKDFSPAALDGYKLNGAIGALPYDFGPLLIFYNKDIFDKYGVPYPKDNWTWDDFVNIAKKLTKSADKIYGFGAMADVWWNNPFILANGGTWFDTAKGELSVNNPKAIQAIQWVADIINVHKASPTIAEQAAMGVFDRWYAGTLAMKEDGPWDLMNSKSRCKFKWGVAAFPLSPAGKRGSHLPGSGFAAYAKTKFPEQAYKAISVITNAASLGYLASQGRAFPARASQQNAFYEAANIDGLKTAMALQLKDSVSILESPNAGEGYTVINTNCMQPIFFGKAKASDIIPKFDAEAREKSRAK